MIPSRGRRLWAVPFVALLLALSSAAIAVAELSAQGDLFVRFGGGIAPRSLPRDSLAPISVRIEGDIKAPAGGEPPALRQISVALNRGGQLNTRGLPVCSRGRLDATTPAEALAACGPSLVGGGGFSARTAFPEQAAVSLPGQVLLFNSVSHGRPAILAHVFQSEPAPITRFVVFSIRRTAGTFGTVIAGQLPESINRNGYLESIFLQLHRRYVSHGRPASYLSASCPTPPDVPVASFPFARVSMGFSDGRELSTVLTRSCRTRG